ncbi:MAG: replication initiator protein A [Pseudomonadota bacterium]
MSLLPERHPNLDFFVLDIADAVPKDDLASMEHPLFSLATKPDMRHLEYRNGDTILKIRPSPLGLPTIFDKDILIFVISQLIARKNRGDDIGDTVRFSMREMCVAINRPVGGDHYKRLANAIDRLQGTQFITNVQTGNQTERRTFSMIDEGGMVKNEDFSRNDFCEIRISKWLLRAIELNEVVSISRDYFRLRRPLERRLYEIARKHCGHRAKWHIGLAKLQMKTGSNAPIKRFRHNLREIINSDVTPFYRFEIDGDDLVTVRPRKAPARAVTADIKIPEWAEEKAREIAREKGWDFYALRDQWLDFAKSEVAKGNAPDNAGAAFVGYCKKQDALR